MILIFGAGFLGTAIYHHLRKNSSEVRIFSRHIPADLQAGGFAGDIADIMSYSEVFRDVHTVIHTIHTTVPATSFEREEYDVVSNAVPFLRLLNQCRANGVQRFLFLSTGGAIYGEQTDDAPVTEDTATNPISSYGVTKLINEKYLLLRAADFPAGTVVLRPSNIYGAGQKVDKPQGIIGHLINAANHQRPIDIWGDGTATKDYLYIDDFLRAISRVVTSDRSGVFNLSSGMNYSVREIIAIIEEITQKRIDARFGPDRPFDVQRVRLDSSRFRAAFDWAPETDLRAGIALTVRKRPEGG